jgi:hypothetical protein
VFNIFNYHWRHEQYPKKQTTFLIAMALKKKQKFTLFFIQPQSLLHPHREFHIVGKICVVVKPIVHNFLKK